MVKPNFTEKLKKWRHDHQEDYARNIIQTPKEAQLYSLLPFPGLVLVMGDRRMGKTGLAHEGANLMHKRRGLTAVIHMPNVPENIRRSIQRHLPNWMKVVVRRSEWPKNCIVIYDEAAQSAHARRSQSGDAVELDDLIGVSGQRNQLIFFISHHSRKLDVNVITEVNRIIWKKPTYAHQLFERDEVSDFSMKAYDFFDEVRGVKQWTDATRAKAKKLNLVLDFDQFAFYQCKNNLPPWWNEDLSRLFQDVQRISKGVVNF